MEIWFFFLLLFVLAPLARALGRRIERRELPSNRSEEELRKQLLQAEQRLADSETRLSALEERVDFYERLLAKPNE